MVGDTVYIIPGTSFGPFFLSVVLWAGCDGGTVVLVVVQAGGQFCWCSRSVYMVSLGDEAVLVILLTGCLHFFYDMWRMHVFFGLSFYGVVFWARA